MRVLIIPEDPTLDRHILKPIVERVFQEIGRKAQIEMLEDPHLTGVSHALNQETIQGIITDNPMVSLFLLMVDRDGPNSGHEQSAARLEETHTRVLRTCLAIEEVEVWMIALHRDKLGATWGEVRAHRDPKEAFVWPFLEKMGWRATVGRGYKRAMRELAGQFRGLVAVCPEIAELQVKIQQWGEGTSNVGR